jgi:hypothetical protein
MKMMVGRERDVNGAAIALSCGKRFPNVAPIISNLAGLPYAHLKLSNDSGRPKCEF